MTRNEQVPALLAYLFERYVSCMVTVSTPLLTAHPGHGFPRAVAANPAWKSFMPLHLDAMVFDKMALVLHAEHLSCTLSFDALYDVEIPYASILGIAMMFPPEEAPVEEPKPPSLRLVEDN